MHFLQQSFEQSEADGQAKLSLLQKGLSTTK
jgi:hypothetical protein